MSDKTVILKFNDYEKEEEIFAKCSKHLKEGNLVSFPTETVYGLGANALDEDAVKKIFKAKGRPLTDPVICHVYCIEQALELVDLSTKEQSLFEFLAKNFWPGPLTIVSKCNRKLIPECVTAGTNFVGIRQPRNETALKLIKAANLPISAPSANRFGHVSPTNPQHVFDDLSDCGYPILILDSSENCEIGIESTVAKVEEFNSEIYLTILRRGGISVENIEKILEKYSEKVHFSTSFKTVSNDTKIGECAPGQMITHYAPDITTYLVKGIDSNLKDNQALKDVVIIDFGETLISSKDFCLKYFNLSKKSDILEGANNLFDILRKSEKVENAKLILLADVSLVENEHSLALYDRMFRAASGNHVNVTKENIEIIENKI